MIDNQREYIFIGIKNNGDWKEKSFLFNDEISISNYIQEQSKFNVYRTMNTYSHSRRNKTNVLRILDMFVDFDCHEEPITIIQSQEILSSMKKYFNIEIPTPNLVLYTGRGMHFHIKIKNCFDAELYSATWKNLNKIFAKLIQELNIDLPNGAEVDLGCYGPDRFSRVEGTMNIESGKLCQRIFESNFEYAISELNETFIKASSKNYSKEINAGPIKDSIIKQKLIETQKPNLNRKT
ncbi:MAG: hypothetical protein WCI62_04140, partial [Erysipelotrichaceae bacterium]